MGKVIDANLARGLDFLDYQMAWAIQREVGDTLTHHPRCSSVPGWDPISGAGFLCDCGALETEWKRLRKLASEPSDA